MSLKAFLTDWKVIGGVIVTVIVVPCAASIRDQAGRVWANPDETDKLKEENKVLRADQQEMKQTQASLAQQTTAVYTWIQTEEQKRQMEAQHEEEMRKAAPDGMVWDSATRKYVPR